MLQHARRLWPRAIVFAIAVEILTAVALLVAALLASASAQPARSDDWETCAKGSGDDALAACTRAIKSGTYNGRTLALAYSNRGVEWKAKGDLAKAIADYDEAIKDRSAAGGGLQQPRHRLCRRRELRQGHRRLRQGDQAQPEIRLGAQQPRARLFQQGPAPARHRRLRRGDQARARRGAAQQPRQRLCQRAASTTAPSRISTRRSTLDAKYAIAFYNRGNALFRQGRRRPRHRRTTTRRWRSIRSTRTPWSIAASRYEKKRRARPRHRRLRRGAQARSEGRGRLQQPRQCAAQEGRVRPRHRRLRPGDQARRQICRGLFQPRHRPRGQEALRCRHRRLRPRHAAAAAERRGLEQPLLGARHHRPAAGGAGGLQRGARSSSRTTSTRSTAAASCCCAWASTTRRSPTTTRRCKIEPNKAASLYGRGMAKRRKGDYAGGNTDIARRGRSGPTSRPSSRATACCRRSDVAPATCGARRAAGPRRSG